MKQSQETPVLIYSTDGVLLKRISIPINQDIQAKQDFDCQGATGLRQVVRVDKSEAGVVLRIYIEK